jgi:PAS domain S-box-containing protein
MFMTRDPDLVDIYGQLDEIERLLKKLNSTKKAGQGKSGIKEGQIDATIGNLPIGVITLNKEGKILSANPAFLKIFGVKSNTTLQDELMIDLQPVKSGGIEHYFSDLYEKNIDFDFESSELINYSDERIYLHCRGFLVPGSQSTYMLLFSDITRRKRLEEQFTQYQRLESIGKLAGGIAHDFNNILTVIKGAAALTLREMKEDDSHFHNINQIHRAAERAESLTQQLLAFSRRQLLQPKIINLNALVVGLKDQITKQVNTKVNVKMLLAEDTGKIKADPHQIEQVIKNLILNANDAMPGGGDLTVETANEMLDEDYLQRRPLVNAGRYVMLAISDTGKGMDKNTQAHIFEPFFTTKSKGQGTGLGLSTVYGIVKQSSGYIWVYSEPDKGTVLKLYFPFYDETSDVTVAQVATDSDLRGNETVLVVDDEEQVRNLVSEMLRFYGYNVLEAPSAGNALLIFNEYKESIDLVLTDIVMPQMNGVEMAEKIIADSQYPKSKIVFMSGYTDNTIDEYELIDKSNNFLQKPFNALDLVDKVRKILDQ